MVDRVRELQEDLADGDDLAMAMRLVGDALARRLRRAHRSIRDLDGDAGIEDERFDQLVSRINVTLDRYEDEATRSREKLQTVIDQFQELLDGTVTELQELVADESDDA